MNEITVSTEIKNQIDALNYDGLLRTRNQYINKAYSFNEQTKEIVYDQVTYTNIINVVKYIDKLLSIESEFEDFKKGLSVDAVEGKIGYDAADADKRLYNLNVDILYYQTMAEDMKADAEFSAKCTEIVEFIKRVIQNADALIQALNAPVEEDYGYDFAEVPPSTTIPYTENQVPATTEVAPVQNQEPTVETTQTGTDTTNNNQ